MRRTSHLGLFKITLVLLIGSLGFAAHADDVPRRVKVLFLGDNGHHRPIERARQVYSAMAERGVDFTYTEDPNELNAANLARFDCVLLYANIDKATPEQEKALIDYVESGHGFAPIHCASYCFLNSPKLTALTGGRFKSHGTGVFKESIALPDHPILKGLQPIESWDESYVHEMHNEQDRTVLSYRVEGDKKEPYTWVRTQGKGRVFYTAWGHDERTWGNKDFQNLLERGVRWAAGDWALQPQPKFKPFEYAEANIPNYIPSEVWGTTGEPIRMMQEPVSPEESLKHMVIPPGFSLKLVAAEPKVMKPIALAFDERGRLWLAETFDYPNEMQKPGEGHDRITICEDTDGDGVADKFTLFADRLSIPTSLCFANGGVIVTQAPDMLFLKDTDGDDKADLRKTLFTGWGTADTHAGPSNLRYGFDNWIYGSVGYSGFRGTVGGQAVSFGQGVFRFKPDGSKLEFLSSANNNMWGLGFSENGDLLASTANNNPSFQIAIPNRYYEQTPGLPARTQQTIADTPHFYPTTNKIRQVDQHGAYTAGAGHALYTARSFPQSYWNSVAFVTEPTGHLIGQFIIQPDGSGFRARNDFSLLGSDDEWTAPIVAEVGPDGALWWIDWYNFIVQHNPIPRGFEKGKGNAYVTPARDKRHGRVYRMIWNDGKPSKTFDLSKASTSQLIEALKSENQLWRLHAQRLLVEKGDKSAVAALVPLIQDSSVDAIGLNPTAVHALWTIQGLGGFDQPDARAAAVVALRHPSAGVRQAALDVLPRDEAAIDAILSSGALSDASLLVRKAALLALAEMPTSEKAGAAVFKVLSDAKNQNDRWIAEAATIAAARHDAGFLKSAFAAYPKHEETSGQKIERAANLIPNASFEEGTGEKPNAWRVRTYGGSAQHAWVNEGRNGGKCLKITSKQGSDTSWFIDVPVEPDTDYTLSAWIRTDGMTGAMGALLNVHGTETRTPPVTRTGEWRKVETSFNSGGMSRVSINCLFGGWGFSKGTAWYDDLELRRADTTLPGVLGRAVRTVTGVYARRGATDSVVGTVASLKTADSKLAAAVIEGLAAGWPADAKPTLSDSDAKSLRETMEALPPESRDSLITLAEKWGATQMFANEISERSTALAKTLADNSADTSGRIDAARRLVAMADKPQTVAAILKQASPSAPPELQRGLIDSLSAGRSAETGAAVVNNWSKLAPAAQRAAVGVLLRNPDWTKALLDGIEAGKINPKDLRPENWQVLKVNPDSQIASRAAQLEKAGGRESSPDKKKLIAGLLPAVEKKGDVAVGKAVFTKNCAVCHTLEGEGGKVGPELTGIGARPKAEILAEVIDPNRSVEGTYRQWIVQTKDGEVLTGRLLSESRTSVELIDATAKTHVIERKDVKQLRASDLSVMPEGFEQLPPEEIGSLLEYLSQSKVKH